MSGNQCSRAETGDIACYVVLLNVCEQGDELVQEKRQRNNRKGLLGNGSTPPDRRIRLERAGRDCEMNHHQSRPGSLQAVLTSGKIETVREVESSRGEERSTRGSRPSGRLKSPKHGRRQAKHLHPTQIEEAFCSSLQLKDE